MKAGRDQVGIGPPAVTHHLVRPYHAVCFGFLAQRTESGLLTVAGGQFENDTSFRVPLT
ncbi:hypothetical protein [Streptomyces sp. NPDC005046]